jgi:hypothetical protein
MLYYEEMTHYFVSFYMFRKQEMASIGFLLVCSLTLFSSAFAYGGSWTNAHATFYGGSDASGTMGMSYFSI